MDRNTLETLVQSHQSEIYRYLRYLGAQPVEAEDLVQDTFVAAYGESRMPDPNNPPLCAGWLRGIARNRFLMHCRSRRTARHAIDSKSLERSEEVWRDQFLRDGDGFDYLEALRQCLGVLSERHQQLLK